MKTNNSSANSAYMSIVLILLILVACRDRVTPPDDKPYVSPITLTFEDASCTEAWIRIKTTRDIDGRTLILKRDGITQSQISNLKSQIDTLIVDEGLLPKQIYTYKAFLHNSNDPSLQIPVDSSAPLILTTMDTTSHNYTWRIDTLGDGASSVLRDVCIINDTLAYAVGEINVKDSLGNWINPPYNFAKWNGKKWELARVMYPYQGSYYYSQLYSVFCFNENDYWVSSNQPMHWNGTKWRTFDLPSTIWNGWIYKMWGSSSHSIYIVGMNGNIAHYNGTSWRRLESGTNTNINDIWGIVSKIGDNEDIYCAVSSFFTHGDRKILKLINKGSVIDSVRWGISNNVFSIWTQNGNVIYTAGEGVFENSRRYWREAPLPKTYTNLIRGTSKADIFVVGDFGLVAHFNGVTWYVFNEVYNAQYSSISINDKSVICTGQREGKGIALVGKRN